MRNYDQILPESSLRADSPLLGTGGIAGMKPKGYDLNLCGFVKFIENKGPPARFAVMRECIIPQL